MVTNRAAGEQHLGSSAAVSPGELLVGDPELAGLVLRALVHELAHGQTAITNSRPGVGQGGSDLNPAVQGVLHAYCVEMLSRPVPPGVRGGLGVAALEASVVMVQVRP